MWSGLLSSATDVLNKAAEVTTKMTAEVTETVKTEHTKFLDEKEKYSGPDESVDQDKLLPWDFADSRLRGTSEEAKDRVLRLSQDERTFITEVPDGVEFEFEFDKKVEVAMKLLELDPNLNKARFKLVPRKVQEPAFWCNYFYRVSLIRRAILDGAEHGDVALDGEEKTDGAAADAPATATASEAVPISPPAPPVVEATIGLSVSGAEGIKKATASKEAVSSASEAPSAGLVDADAELAAQLAEAEADEDDSDLLDMEDPDQFEAALESALQADEADGDEDELDDDLEAQIRQELGLGDDEA